jgi:hypothetical protein
MPRSHAKAQKVFPSFEVSDSTVAGAQAGTVLDADVLHSLMHTYLLVKDALNLALCKLELARDVHRVCVQMGSICVAIFNFQESITQQAVIVNVIPN